MKFNSKLVHILAWGLFAHGAITLPAAAQSAQGLSARAAAVAQHWTPERIRQATPRDLLIDDRGLGYLKQRDGYLQPYGHSTEARTPERRAIPSPFGKPSGGGDDTTPPVISDLNPADGQTIGLEHAFRATVTDASGVSRVDFKVGTSTFSGTQVGENLWGVNLRFNGEGAWTYQVVAKDGAAKGGNTATSPATSFTVSAVPPGGGGGGGGGTDPGPLVTETPWDPAKTGTDAVTKASGRIYFEMPTITTHRKWGTTTTWNGYVCSGTVASDGVSGRSVIITAAHCVYDDVNKMFARNVLFIPNQNATTGTGTDGNCGNDPMGCWAPSFGVVDNDWTNKTFPANIPWDYAYYVVSDSGAHLPGTDANGHVREGMQPILDVAAGSLSVPFSAPTQGNFTHALGYSYSQDPSLRYCAENLATEGSYNDLWLSKCDLSGGASGGPWVQPLTNGTGPIVSVNSWGYTTQPGMGGPPLSGNTAACRFADAETQPLGLAANADGRQGYVGTGGSNCGGTP